MKAERLKKEIKTLQDYLGPRVGYNSNYWPRDPNDKRLMQKLIRKKMQYYSKMKRKNLKKILIALRSG